MMTGKAMGPFIGGSLAASLGYDVLFYLVAASNFAKLFLYSCLSDGPRSQAQSD